MPAVCWIALAGPGLFPSAPLRAQANQQKPVATVGREPIYEPDYRMQVRTQVYKAQLQEYTIRRKALDAVINQKLLKAEAGRLGIKEDDLLKREGISPRTGVRRLPRRSAPRERGRTSSGWM